MKKKIAIVLKKDLEGLGQFGDTKEVAAGYARNFLIPNGVALYLSDKRSKEILNQRERIEKERQKETKKIRETATKLVGAVVKFESKVGKGDKLYGAIGADDLCQKLVKDYKIKLKPSQIEMKPQKTAGESEAKISFGPDIEATVKVIIVKESLDAAPSTKFGTSRDKEKIKTVKKSSKKL